MSISRANGLMPRLGARRQQNRISTPDGVDTQDFFFNTTSTVNGCLSSKIQRPQRQVTTHLQLIRNLSTGRDTSPHVLKTCLCHELSTGPVPGPTLPGGRHYTTRAASVIWSFSKASCIRSIAPQAISKNDIHRSHSKGPAIRRRHQYAVNQLIFLMHRVCKYICQLQISCYIN